MPRSLILYTHTHTHTHVKTAKSKITDGEFGYSIAFMSSSGKRSATRGSIPPALKKNKALHTSGFPIKWGMTQCGESGRSMVEVIAVLAVAAVIGAGSLEGFTSAMRKYRANELITEASGRALAVSQQLMVGKELKDTDFGGYPATDTGHGKFPEKPIPLTGDEFFKIPITGMDKPTCDQMKAIAGGSLRRVDCKEENGKFTADLIYQKDLSETAGTIPGDTDGTSGGTGNSATRSYDNNRSGCEENGYQYCSNNICITKEEVCQSGTASCAAYPGTSPYNSGGHAGKADDGETMCYCPGGQVYSTTAGGCIPACSGHGTLDANEDCVCQGGYTGVVCESVCSGNGTLNEADKCECDENWYGPLCDSDCDGWRGNCGGSCELCNCNRCAAEDADTTSASECARCSNREMITTSEGDKCVLSTAVCNARYPTAGWFRDNNGSCYSCSYSDSIFSSKDECDKCATSSTPRFGSNGGWCYSCSDTYNILTSKDECDKCSNREMYNGYCILTTATCNALYPTTGGFRNNYGNCYSCSYSGSPFTSQDECDQCGTQRTYNTSTGRCKKA